MTEVVSCLLVSENFEELGFLRCVVQLYPELLCGRDIQLPTDI